jgi:hypothetical protein
VWVWEDGRIQVVALLFRAKEKRMKYLPLFFMVLLAGCFQPARKSDEGVQIDNLRKTAVNQFVGNTANLQRATLKGYQAEGYAHTATKHSWDNDKIDTKAKDLLIESANKQDVAPAKAKIDAAEFLKFASDAKSWADKTAREWDANRVSVDARVTAVEQLIAQAQTDYATAMRLEALLDQMDSAGLPPQIIQQAGQLIQQILGNKGTIQAPALPATTFAPATTNAGQ